MAQGKESTEKNKTMQTSYLYGKKEYYTDLKNIIDLLASYHIYTK